MHAHLRARLVIPCYMCLVVFVRCVDTRSCMHIYRAISVYTVRGGRTYVTYTRQPLARVHAHLDILHILLLRRP